MIDANFENRKPVQQAAENGSHLSEAASKTEEELRKLLSAHVVVI